MIKQTQKTNAIYAATTDALEYFESLKDAREETYDNRSETWQEGEKGEEYSDDTNSIEEIVEYLESAKSSIEELYEY